MLGAAVGLLSFSQAQPEGRNCLLQSPLASSVEMGVLHCSSDGGVISECIQTMSNWS